MKILNKFYPHLLAIIGFVVVSLIYFYPVLQGKQLSQSDIVQYTGMAKEQNDFRQNEKTEPYWTNSAFGGMPTYQMGANYPHNYIKKLDSALRFLPRPADYLFLYFLGFYGLLLVLKTDPLKAFFGALAFGFSTYLIIILGVGHNAKAHAIAYMPLVVAGTILVFRKRFILGGLVTMIAAALEINANHFQMTYYLMILLLVIAVYFIYVLIKEKDFKSLFYSIGVFAIAGILAIGANAANLLATAEYANFSMRGKSELTFNPDGTKNETKSAMDYDYITEYSYGIAESLNLIAPRLFGGSNSENLGPNSNVSEFIIKEGGASTEQAKEFTEQYGLTYWGDQPIVAAPAYIGAIVFFLCVFALFNDKRKIKYAFLAGAIVALLLSWGKNFNALTAFFIDYVPMYDKFRAVSSIQVVLELCIPVLAIMGLHTFFKSEKEKQWDSLWKSAAVSLGLLTFLFIIKGFFDYSGGADEQLAQMFAQSGPGFGEGFITALKADRKSMYTSDLLRSGIFIALAILVLWLNIKNKLSQTSTVIIVGLLMVTDLVVIDKNYVDTKGFVSAREVREPFQPTEADLQILKDTSIYRVYDVQGRLQGRTSYFHKAVGGYSAVRPRRMDQLFDYQIDRSLADIGKMISPETMGLTKSIPVLNALNVKYLLLQTNDGKEVPVINPFAYGNAWFVSDVKKVASADEEMKNLGTADLKNTAVVNQKEFADVKETAFVKDSTATIIAAVYKPNYIKYTSQNANKGLAVFSEIYYPKGWNVYVDGNPSTHFRTDYVLRGMLLPPGKHTVEFKFEPQVVKTGSILSLISTIVMLLLLIGGIWYERREEKRNKNQEARA